MTAVMDLGVKSDPNMHRAHKRPIQSADRSTATRMASRETSEKTGRQTSQLTFCGSGKPMELNERSSKSGGMENTRLDTQNHPLRDEAQLNCVSLRPSLDYELGWRAVKGQHERCLSAPPLTALQPSSIRDGRNKYEKVATSALTFMTFS